MAYIPDNAKWYIAILVIEITVNGDSRNVVHSNYMLIRADSPDEAYDKAIALGHEHDSTYSNPQDSLVQITFKGLRNLNVIHDEIEHGAEIMYEEMLEVSDQHLQSLVRPRHELTVFRPKSRSTHPNYASKEILEEARGYLDKT